MSTINTNSIDANYPVPGQNNSTQGFRNNFAAIKQNLNIASSEITDLQNKAVLKTALANSTLNNDMGNTLISNASTLGFRATTYNLGNALTDTVTVDLTLGDVQYGNLAGNIFLNFGSWAPTDTVSNVTLQLGRPNNVADFSITFPTEAVFNENYGWTLVENSSNPNSLATLTFPFDCTQLNLLISTVDCGNTLFVTPINRPFQTNQIQKRTPPSTGQLGDVIGTTCIDNTEAVQLVVTGANTDPFFTVSDTTGLYSGQPVTFTGVSLESNITVGNTYYVGEVLGATTFTVTSTPGGSNIAVAGNVTGNTMLLNPISYMYVAVDNYNATSYNKNVGETTAPDTITVASAMGNVLVNYPVIFTGNGLANANIQSNKVYYIKSVSGSDITLSETRYNGVAGPTFEGILTFSTTTSLPIDFTVYDGADIFRRIPLQPF
jgi:hypothetical protein